MSISAGESKSTGIPNITELKFEHQDIKKKNTITQSLD